MPPRGIVDHQKAVDRVFCDRAVADLTGRLVVDRIDGPQHRAARGIGDQQGARLAVGKRGPGFRGVEAGAFQRAVRGEAHVEVGIEDAHGGDVGLAAEVVEDAVQAGKVALEHGVFERGLQQGVDLQRGPGVFVGDTGAVQVGDQQEKQRGGRHQNGGQGGDEAPLQAGADPGPQAGPGAQTGPGARTGRGAQIGPGTQAGQDHAIT